MKRILLLLLVVILLVGCGAPGEVEYEKPEADVGGPDVKETELPAEKVPAKTTTTRTEPTFLSDELEELAEKADTVSSMDYAYSGFVKGTAGYYAHVYVKGDKMRQDIDLGSGTYQKGTLYDVAYIDLAKGTVEAYCEHERCNDRNKIITTDISKFNIETPFDVLNRIDKGFKKGSAMFENRNCIIVEYESNGKTVRVWMWDYKGLPLKYEVRDGEELLEKIEFIHLVINGVKDDQLSHKHLGEFD